MSYPNYPNYGHGYYVTTVLSLDPVRFHFLNRWPDYHKTYNLFIDQEEDLYDWLVNEAFNRVCNMAFQTRISDHHRHDVYKCVYDDCGPFIQTYVSELIRTHKLYFTKDQKVKTLVAGNSLFIVKRNN